MDNSYLPFELILDPCKQHLAKLQQSNTTGLIEIHSRLIQGQYKIECKYGYFQNFLIAPKDLADWKTFSLPKLRKHLETEAQVLTMLNSALFETVHQYQGYASIIIYHCGKNNQYEFQFRPSLVHGVKLS
ncbi:MULTISPECIES: hypothetical protein [unclassified Anabaena]|uniref:hypothetical protein n=1 Tax=unclassified Anabaena TaxID=2619674 RepID=UPI0039C66B64